MTKKEQRELQELIRAIEQQKNKQHIRNIAAYQAEVTKIFETVANEAARLGVNLNVPDDKLLSFDDIPTAKRRVNKLLKSMRQQLEATVVNGIEAEWALANAKNDALVEQVAAAGLTAAGNAEYFNNHAAALKAFKDRSKAGMNLSKRVWNLTQQYKTELEMGLDIGIREGLSAQEMSRQMKQYLKYPDKLFRRVRDERGVLQLSKAAAAFHPGRGVYRSSHMNALRLTGTETNMAYRAADHERIQDLDFVVGIRVVLSNNHTIKGPKGLPIPLTDICDELSAPMGSTATKGRGCYPKDFKFTGWHPNCRCHTETILLTAAEMNKRLLALRRGEAYNVRDAKSYVAEAPSEFNRWVESNTTRIMVARAKGKEPYFLRDNKTFVNAVLAKPAILQKLKAANLVPKAGITYVSFEPFSPIIVRHMAKYRHEKQKQRLLREIMDSEKSRIMNYDPKGFATKVFPGHKTDNWEKTFEMAKKVNWNGADVVFLPEYPEDTSADAITKIAGMFRIVDFKCSSSTKWNTLQADLEKGFTQAEAIVLKLEKMNCNEFIQTIEYMKRNRMKLGDIKLLNAQGHGVDLTLKDLQSYLYKKKARRLL
jgi:hypothetical protein